MEVVNAGGRAALAATGSCFERDEPGGPARPQNPSVCKKGPYLLLALKKYQWCAAFADP